MAEYVNVEKPFLDKVRQLGWQVIDQGIGVPNDPTVRKSKVKVAKELENE